MKRSGEHEVVVASELAHARVELAVVDETARFADYEERKHDPGLVSKESQGIRTTGHTCCRI